MRALSPSHVPSLHSLPRASRRLTRSLSFVEHASPANRFLVARARAQSVLVPVGEFRGVLLFLRPLLLLVLLRRYLLLAASSSSPRSSECRASSARSAECHFTFVGLRRVGDRALPGIILSFRALVTSPCARISASFLAAASSTTDATTITTTTTRTIASTTTIAATRFLAVTSRRLLPPPPRPPPHPSPPPLSLLLPSLSAALPFPRSLSYRHFLLLLLLLLLQLLLFFFFFRHLLHLFSCLDEGPFAHGTLQPGE